MTVTTLNRPGLPARHGIAALLADAREEVLAMNTLTSAGPAFGLRDVRPTVRYRAIYPDTARTAPSMCRHLTAMTMAGAAIRTVPVVELNALVIDRAIAVLPTDGPDGNVAVLRLNSVVAAATGFFERLWPSAVPMADSEVPVTAELSPREREVLRLMTLGMTDEHVAAKLGVSVRTIRRMVAHLMNRLGARSRFQAGVKAAERGWLLDWRS
ncbi:LuxR family transcriptional regulator [Kribbella antibiotica]|uniref:LuxR family transcriptional regulator n=1 Tax=Kribbella antibiotica TaxID=190195 RepID=A0A4R4Z8F9_9ACTN|nr:helix-turn-helix transcriptional regulator [Kribbella antibiotica]TDD54455.1 LuxR family transcriptional regulator [Kribbella antibiotica]